MPKRGFVLPKYLYTGPYNPLHLPLDSQGNPLPRDELFNAVDAISIRYDICYRDNDLKMLAELNERDEVSLD